MAPDDKDKEPELEEAMAQLNLEPVTKMLVDGGAAVNIMPYVMLHKLGKNQDDLTKTDMMLKDFEGVVSPALGHCALI